MTGSRWQAAGCRAQVVGRRSQVAGRRQVCSAGVRLVRLTAALTLTLTRRAAGAADGSSYPPLHEEDLCLVKWKGLGYEAATWEAGTLLLTLADAAARVAEYEVWSDRPLQLDTSRHRPRPQGTETPYEKPTWKIAKRTHMKRCIRCAKLRIHSIRVYYPRCHSILLP